MEHYTLVLTLLLTLSAIHITLAMDYCNRELCSGKPHIACGRNGTFRKRCPSDARMVKMTTDLKNVLLHSHNSKRNFVASGSDEHHPRACRMATMQWDNELATLAALNVKQCIAKNDACHATSKFRYSGQSVLQSEYHGRGRLAKRLKEIVNVWFAEISDSSAAIVRKYPKLYTGPGIEHFTLMMNEASTHLGCAAATYTSPDQPLKQLLVACNYAAANIVGAPVYRACWYSGSHCRKGKNQAYRNLCSIAEVYKMHKYV